MLLSSQFYDYGMLSCSSADLWVADFWGWLCLYDQVESHDTRQALYV